MEILNRKRHYLEGTKFIYSSAPDNYLLYSFVCVGHIVAGHNHYVHRQNYNAYSLVYCQNGNAKIITGNKTFEIKKGQFAFYSLIESSILKITNDIEPFIADFIYINGPNINYFYEEIKKIGLVIDNFNNKIFTATINDIYEKTINKKLNFYDISTQIYNLLMNASKAFMKKNNDPYVYRAINYIHNNYKEKISLQDMAEKAIISKFYFIKRFKNTTGMTPKQYLNKVRLEHSKILLNDNSLNIEDIAQLSGFENTRNLNNAYRNAFNLSTSEYREKILKQIKTNN